MIGLFGQTYAQVNSSLLHLGNSSNTQMNNVANPHEGSMLFGSTESSLFQYENNQWIQLRQELKVCNEQLSILNGNSVALDAINSEYGRTIVWNGNKWESNEFLNIDTLAGTTAYENATHISTLMQSAVVHHHNNREMILENQYLYVLSSPTGTSLSGTGANGSGGIEIIDVSSGTMTHEGSILGSHDTYNNLGDLRSFCKKGNYLYVSNGKGVVVINVSNPSNPFLQNSYYELLYIDGLVRNYDNHIYFAYDDKMVIYEITSNGAALSEITTINVGVSPSDMIVKGNVLFLLEGNTIVAADLSNPISPVLHTQSNSTNFPISSSIGNYSSVIKDNRLFFASNTNQGRLITSVDISDISNMTVSGFIDYNDVPGFSGHKHFHDLVIDDNLLIGHGQLGSNYNFVCLFDISNLNSISYLDTYNAPNPQPNVWRAVNEITILRNDTFFVAAHLYNSYNYKIDRYQYTPNVNIGTPSGIHALNVNGQVSKQGGGNWAGYSDKRLKKNIRPYTKGLEVVRNINPYQFNYRSNSGYSDTTSTFTGVLAQEMQLVLPQSVSPTNDTNGPSGLKDKLQFDSSPILWNLVNAVQELKKEQDLIEERINSQSDEK